MQIPSDDAPIGCGTYSMTDKKLCLNRLQAFKLKTLFSTNLDKGLCHGGGTLLLQTYDTRNRPRSS